MFCTFGLWALFLKSRSLSRWPCCTDVFFYSYPRSSSPFFSRFFVRFYLFKKLYMFVGLPNYQWLPDMTILIHADKPAARRKEMVSFLLPLRVSVFLRRGRFLHPKCTRASFSGGFCCLFSKNIDTTWTHLKTLKHIILRFCNGSFVRVISACLKNPFLLISKNIG